MKSKAFERTARWNPQVFVDDPVTNLAAPQLRLAFRRFALLTALLVPLGASAENWQMQVGAQTGDKAHQALAFLPNEIWIHPGDSITWTFPTSELHSVTFLTPGQIRPSRFVGCPGTNSTPDLSVVDGGACVNSGILMDGATYTVVFPEAGNFKGVCLAHNDQTGTVHVLELSAPLPHDQAFYNREADSQRARLISDARNAARVTTDHNAVIAGVGNIHGTSGGTESASVMRFIDETKVIHVGETVEWTTSEAATNHTITFGPEPDELDQIPPSANVTVDADGARHAYISSSADAVHSGFITQAPQDRIGLAQAPLGVTRFRVTFTQPGTYLYKCVLHDNLGMVGKVIVLP